jgi:hypothetical protein
MPRIIKASTILSISTNAEASPKGKPKEAFGKDA